MIRQDDPYRLLDAGTFDELGQLAPIFLGKLYGQWPQAELELAVEFYS